MGRSLDPTTLSPTAGERALSSYFLTKVAVGVADEFSAELWHYLLPQATHTLVPVWHASNAVAAYAWSTNPAAKLAPGAAYTLDHEGAQHYSASMKTICSMVQRPSLSTQEKTTVLLASILYAIYAGKRCDTATFNRLRDMNCALIRHWKFWECMECPDVSVSGAAAQILYYFVKESALPMAESILQAPYSLPGAWLDALRWLQNRPLASVVHAYIEFELLWASTKAVFGSLSLRPTAADIRIATSRRAVLWQHVMVWEARCAELFSTALYSSFHVTLIRVQNILITILFKLKLERFTDEWDETCLDDFQPQFAAAFDLVASLCVAGKGSTGSIPSDVGVPVQVFRALTFIARGCRVPVLRRKAAVLQMAVISARIPVEAKDLDTLALPKRLSNSQIILLEEIAWRDDASRRDCATGKECVRDKFICNRHRVAKSRVGGESKPYQELTLQTVGEVLDGRPGRNVYVSGTLPNQPPQWTLQVSSDECGERPWET